MNFIVPRFSFEAKRTIWRAIVFLNGVIPRFSLFFDLFVHFQPVDVIIHCYLCATQFEIQIAF